MSESTKQVDVAIMGGGLAGLTLATASVSYRLESTCRARGRALLARPVAEEV